MTISAAAYHQKTAYDRYKMEGHAMDWKNQPSLYKNYPQDAHRISLPLPVPGIDHHLSEICRSVPVPRDDDPLTLKAISRIIFNAYRITARTRYRSGEYHYRSVASAGALYPFELYMACRSVTDLEEGLYHYDIRSHALIRIRQGAGVTLSLDEGGKSELTFFITSIFFRTSWKYRDRSYRYHLLDTGHLAENLILTLKAVSLPSRLHYDFDDAAVNRLLGLNTEQEACMAVLRVPGCSELQYSGIDGLEPLPETFRQASQVAEQEVRYPLVSDIHRASSSVTAATLPCSLMIEHLGPSPSFDIFLSKPSAPCEPMNFTEAVSRRRSLRNFIQAELSSNQWNLLLELLCQGEELERSAVGIGMLANHVEGLSPGCYLLNPVTRCLGRVSSGEMANLTAHICLGQEWLSYAALHIFFAANLKILETMFGTRGYRYALIHAGRLGERIYLGATSMGLGCCGIGAFYDAEAAQLLDLNDDSALIYLLAAGPVKKMIG